VSNGKARPLVRQEEGGTANIAVYYVQCPNQRADDSSFVLAFASISVHSGGFNTLYIPASTMSQTVNIQCPQGHLVAIEEQYLGRKVRCPHCQVIMIAPRLTPAELPVVAPVVEDEDDDEIEEEKPRQRKKGGAYRAGMKQVARGYDVYYVRIYLIVLTFIAVILLFAFTYITRDSMDRTATTAGSAAILLVLVMGLAGLAIAVMEIVALVYLSSTPERIRTQNTYRCYLVAAITSYVLWLISVIMGASLAPWGSILMQIAYFVSFIFYILVTKKVALHLDRDDLAGKVQGLIYLAGITLLGNMFLAIANSAFDKRGIGVGSNELGFMIGIIGLVIFLGGGIWFVISYVGLLTELRKELKKETSSG
jgi:hypothetical protein